MTTDTRPLVVFDFDGVLSDSFLDSLWMAINTYVDLVPDHGLPVDGPLPAKAIEDFVQREAAFAACFHDLMPLGNLARDYYVILHAMTQGRDGAIQSQADYDRYKATLDSGTVMAFDAAFYARRRRLQTEDPQAWAGLIPVFQGIPQAVDALSHRARLAIATSKDLRSVKLLLDRYGLTRYFPPEWILDKDFAPSKRQHLIRLSERTGTPFQRMHFIDDKVTHLVDVADLGVNLYLAAWGFNTPREAEVAKALGARVLALYELATVV